jgi:Zn finger protein HypA/HybF involved in hydrogenase expression
MSQSQERIPHGQETRKEEFGLVVYIAPEGEECPDCGAERGEIHKNGCDVEQCPVCGSQLISCEHGEHFLEDKY